MHSWIGNVFEIHWNIPMKIIDSLRFHRMILEYTYHSHTRILLSSDVETIRRFRSTNVTVLIAPKCRSYS